ncbi:MOB kinase activator 3A [Sparganum proliferum]
MAFAGFKDIFVKQKTFRPKKKFPPETIRYHLHKQAEASLSAGVDLREAVKKPADEELNDWIAVHVVDFYNRINLIYGTICDRCTAETCPRMTGGKKFEYHWRDNNRYRKPTPVSAPEYIGLLMDWIDEQINDPVLFPTSMDVPFPKNYRSAVKKIMSRLYRVFVHVYIHHFDRLMEIGAEAHVNVCYKHFYYFVTYFDLIDPKELEPLRELTQRICILPPARRVVAYPGCRSVIAVQPPANPKG